MHIRQIRAKEFKRFTDLTVTDLPASAKLVVLTGQNGSGKSSLFDALQFWHGINSRQGLGMDEVYAHKKGLPIAQSWHQGLVNVEFHEQLPADQKVARKVIYIRSAYRNEPDFTME